jgi:DNA-binding GntR family transcriptional regulator
MARMRVARGGRKPAPPGLEPSGLRPDVRTLPERIADLILQAIFDGSLAPGQPLRQADLAAQFGVSRIPLREALRQLEADGFVAFHSYRGATVALLDPEEVRDLYDIRIVLESRVLRLAIPRMTAETLHRAAEILAEQAATESPAQMINCQQDFYMTILEPSDRPYLLLWVERLLLRGRRYLPVALRNPTTREMVQKRTKAILDACKRKDADAAVKALERLYVASSDLIVEALRADERPLHRGRRSTDPKPPR